MQPTIILGLSLFVAYLLGDFPLQSFQVRKQRSWIRIIGQCLFHWVLVLLLIVIFAGKQVSLSWRLAMLTGAYAILHLTIDMAKRRLIDHWHVSDSTKLFLADQGLHGAIVLGFAFFVTGIDWPALRGLGAISESTKNLFLAALVVYLSVVFVGGSLIRYMTKGLVRNEQMPEQESTEQLENAGLYIGWLERFLIVTAVVLRSPTLIGLILTGKSIARFPEMKEPKFAEYFLIGTLLSFTLALLGGLLLLRLWKGSVSFQ